MLWRAPSKSVMPHPPKIFEIIIKEIIMANFPIFIAFSFFTLNYTSIHRKIKAVVIFCINCSGKSEQSI